MAVPFDPFAAEIDGYSDEKFYVSAEDKRGHSKSWRYGSGNDEVVNMKPYVVAAVAQLRAALPQYRSNQDVFRDLIIHGLHMRAQQMKNDLPSSWLMELERVTAMLELERLEDRREQHEQTLAKIERGFRNARSDEELYDVLRASEVAAMTLELPYFIRKAGDLIDQYRK